MPSLFAVAMLAFLAPLLGAESLDARLYRQIHSRWQRPWLDGPMQAASDIGQAKVGVALCAGMGLFGGSKARESAKLAMTADILSAAIAYGLKVAVNRPRPEGETDRSNSSFPSGHATGAFALATVFAHQYGRAAIPAYLTASAVGLSRIYLGRHYPSDVLAGSLIGFGSVQLVLRFRKDILRFTLPGLGE